jgi:hypothetical protein
MRLSPEDLCMLWDDTVSFLEQLGLYSGEDARDLACVAMPKRGVVELRVGSVAGHRTHVDLNNKTLEYYDRDRNVNRVMKRLFESSGARCDLKADGVFCDISNADLEGIFASLAAPTSMDYRLGDPKAWWAKKKTYHIWEKCGDGHVDSEDFEFCAISEVLSEAKRLRSFARR